MKICNFCGNSEYTGKRVEYIYHYRDHYVVFRDVPAEVCLRCGMRYFSAQVILELEKRFFEIYETRRQPAQTMLVPIETFA